MIPNGPRGFRPGEPLLPAMQYDWASPVAQTLKNLPAKWETWVRSLGWEDPMEEGVITHCGTLAWRIPMDRGAWRATVHRVTESRTGLSDKAHLADWLYFMPPYLGHKQKQKILRTGGKNTQKNYKKKIFMTQIITMV